MASGAEENDPDTEMVSQHPDDLRTVRHFFGGLLRLLNTGLRPARVPGGWLHCRWGMCQASLLLMSLLPLSLILLSLRRHRLRMNSSGSVTLRGTPRFLPPWGLAVIVGRRRRPRSGCDLQHQRQLWYVGRSALASANGIHPWRQRQRHEPMR